MLTVNCPSCGAPAKFRSHAAVMAVCEFCRTTILKDPGAVEDLGKISEVLEDFTPIQLGTAGIVGGRNFSVVGRIQLRYAHGMWNEWYLLFDDGGIGWLGDSSGMFTVTMQREVKGALPGFDDIVPGRLYDIEGHRYTASEKRTAECIGGQGELPFVVGPGWQAHVADLRSGEQFVTLDYSDSSDGAAPALYSGVAVTPAEMKCQLLRDDEQIKASAGKYRGKLDALDCPSCGSMIKYLPGVTTSLVCPACAAQLDAAGPEAQVLAAGEVVDKVSTTLPLGASANIEGSKYTVIGAMVRADDEGTEWTEYLLYSTKGGFFWLVETDEGWTRATVMKKWPEWSSTTAEQARLDQVTYQKTYFYPATVKFAAGAFNWRVAVGDEVRVHEFEHGTATLAAELTSEELTWSRSTPVAHDQINTWFRSEMVGSGKPPPAKGTAGSSSGAVKFIWWILGLNAIPMLFNFSGTIMIVIIAVIALLFPPKLFRNDN